MHEYSTASEAILCNAQVLAFGCKFLENLSVAQDRFALGTVQTVACRRRQIAFHAKPMWNNVSQVCYCRLNGFRPVSASRDT